ncbi:MAG: hypothetical protein ACW981_13820 [Candidatus Hodarchaeales archaeon]|jgi:hypothetical protein
MGVREVLASVVVSLAVVSAVGYVGLPVLFPVLQETSTTGHSHDYAPSSHTHDLGTVLQSKYMEAATQAGIQDESTSYVNVPDTKINITIKSQSKIVAIFNSPYILGVGDGFTSKRVAFNISLGIEGVGSRTIRLSSFDFDTTTSIKEIGSSVYVNYQSIPLPVGTYTVNVKYKSLTAYAGLNGYLTFNVALANYTRSLWVMEMQ